MKRSWEYVDLKEHNQSLWKIGRRQSELSPLANSELESVLSFYIIVQGH